MKKLLILLGLVLALVLAACNSSEENKSDETNGSKGTTEETGASEVDENAYKAALLKNHLEISTSVRVPYLAISAYIAETANPEAVAEDLEALKAEAITAADEAIAAIEAVAVVDEASLTEDAKTVIAEAKAEVKGAFEAYKASIEGDSADFSAADEKFAAYTDKLTPLFEESGLSSIPDIVTELN